MRQRNPLDSSVPLTHRDPKDLGLICLVKKRKFHFQILSDLRIQSWIFLKKYTLSRKNQDVSFIPIAFMTPIALLMIPGKLDCWSRKRKRTNQPIINPGIKHYDWFILPLLLLSLTMSGGVLNRIGSTVQINAGALAISSVVINE